ncbi:MAG: electron transfer flavoprotein subunit alpha/FixB family protein, partial [Deltaproteobacteria bacterium]
MGNALVVAEYKNGNLKKASRAAFTFAKQYAQKHGGAFHILVIGHGIDGVVEQARRFGAEKIWVADHEGLGPYLAETWAQAVADVAKQADAELVAATASAMSKDLMPRVAVKLGAGMASDIMGETDTGYFLRPVWAGNAVVEAEIKTPVKVVTVRGTEFEPAAEQDAAGDVQKVDVNIDFGSLKKRFVRFDEVKSERPELTEASIIVSGGRGTKGDEGFKLIEQLADLLGAAVGATR